MMNKIKNAYKAITNDKRIMVLLIILAAVFSGTVLAEKLPETKIITDTVELLDKSENTVKAFSATSISTSLAISALPNDFATPLAGTLCDFNTYFVFMLLVLLVERILVVEGTKLALGAIIPLACAIYAVYIIVPKENIKKLATKIFVLGATLVLLVPVSVQGAEKICDRYMDYVEETISDADAGANKVNEVMASDYDEETFFEKISNAFKTAIKDVSDLLNYFKHTIEKCVNAIAILILKTFVVPLLILMLFRWLLNQLFSLKLPDPIQVPKKVSAKIKEYMHKDSLEMIEEEEV